MISNKARIAIHMADATGLGSDLRQQAKPRFRVWRLWMTFATLSLLSSGVAVAVVTILRKGL